jgi:glucose/arabinose dehydrogenase
MSARDAQYLIRLAAFCIVSLLFGAVFAASADAAAPRFKLRQVASGMNAPTWVGAPPGDKRLFVAEQRGVVKVRVNGTWRTFLDTRSRVSSDGEQGLLSVAFDRNYATTKRLWIYITRGNGDGQVVEYRARGNRARPGTRRVILTIPLGEGATNHNGGMLVHGPDGHLYISVGDGGPGGDPGNHAQDRSDLRGSLLRISVARRPYAIPSDNPFVGMSGVKTEIYAFGLRNPWRFSIDRPTGDIHVADVGQDAQEEINRLPGGKPAGANFGWRRFEGTSLYSSGTSLAGGTNHRAPLLTVSHNSGACSITGGLVYRGSRVPALRGRYLYADFCQEWIAGFNGAGKRRFRRAIGVGGISSFGEGPRRDVYVVSVTDGTVHLVVR